MRIIGIGIFVLVYWAESSNPKDFFMDKSYMKINL